MIHHRHVFKLLGRIQSTHIHKLKPYKKALLGYCVAAFFNLFTMCDISSEFIDRLCEH